MARELGVERDVQFLGRRAYSELPDYLREADIGLANFRLTPFRKYAFPLKVIEYMAAGLPVIGTRGSETADFITRHGFGLAIDCTPEALAESVLRLFRDAEEREELARRACEVSSAFAWESLLAREYECVSRALENRG
jgi:glycosyltransferase involved in cell wall biosynthesis